MTSEKNLDWIENIFECKTITQSSLELYKNNLIRLNNNKVPKNINFLNDVEKIQNKIEKYKPNTRRNYIISIVSILSCLKSKPKSTKKINDLYDKYFKILTEYNDTLKKSNTKSDNEKENWIEEDNLNKIYNKIENDALQVKKFDSRKEYDKYLQYVILSLYYLIPPRRNKDYIDMVIGYNPDDKSFNYFDIENRRFIFNNYKTQKTYKEQIIDIPDRLFNILKQYLIMKKYLEEDGDNIHTKYLLTDYNGFSFSKSNSITRILNKIFDKN